MIVGFPARPSGAIKSITRSVIETRKKFVRHRERVTLVGFQRNFLCQHDVACDEVTFGHKAPTNTLTAGAVELVDIHRGTAANPRSLSTMAAADFEIAFRVMLRELFR